MLKPATKTVANTVGELKEILSKVPDHYAVSLTGMVSYGVCIDDEEESIILDDYTYLEQLLDEQ